MKYLSVSADDGGGYAERTLHALIQISFKNGLAENESYVEH